MKETITFCQNCRSPLFFTTPIDDVKLVCSECGLRQFGKNRVLRWENRTARFLSRGIATMSNVIDK